LIISDKTYFTESRRQS